MCASGAMKEMQVISPVHRVCLDKDQERSFAMILKKNHSGLSDKMGLARTKRNQQAHGL